YCGLEGWTSAICTHLSSVKCVGTISYVYSTSPPAGIVTGFGIGKTRSGAAMFHPSAHEGGAGASWGFPAGVPPLTQARRVATCCAVSEGSLEKCPNCGSANHGGIIPL